jgi:integrase/recombinase XerD
MSQPCGLLGDRIGRYLAHKRALGFGYLREERYLKLLDALALERHSGVVDEALVREFLSDAGPGSRSHRLTVVRQFARFLRIEEPKTFIPPTRFLAIQRRRPPTRVLSREEACRFLDACDRLPSTAAFPHRGLVHGMALRVLLLTGLRRSEALGLKNEHVDLAAGIITVHRGKFAKSRFVPVARDLTERLRTYREAVIARVGIRKPADIFFPSADGDRPCSRTGLYKSFRTALSIAGITHGGRGHGPRLHDLRHTFAVLRLLIWYEQGADLNAKLPVLATYLGHVGLATSAVYLHVTQDLVGEVTRRLTSQFGDVITAEVAP